MKSTMKRKSDDDDGDVYLIVDLKVTCGFSRNCVLSRQFVVLCLFCFVILEPL